MTTMDQRKRDVILNWEKDYFKKREERLKDNAKDKYRHLSEEEKNRRKWKK